MTATVERIAEHVGTSPVRVRCWARAGVLVADGDHGSTFPAVEARIAVVVDQLARVSCPAALLVTAAAVLRDLPESCWTGHLVVDVDGHVRVGGPVSGAAWVAALDAAPLPELAALAG